MNTTEFDKLKLTLRSKLSGMAAFDPEYSRCILALNFAERVHTGLRKDGKPEFYHQLGILGFTMNLHSLMMDPLKVYISELLHDTLEDYSHLDPDLRTRFPQEYEFIVRLSKIRNGVKIDADDYFDEISNCNVSSVAKGIDRIHNLSSMISPFTLAKQDEYIGEVHDYFLPMLKKAKRNFPQQSAVYEMIKSTLNLQCDTVTACYKKKSGKA